MCVNPWKYLVIIYKIVVFVLIINHTTFAQTSDSLRTDFLYVKNSQAWFTSQNTSGLHRFYLPHISTTAIKFTKQNGDFIDYFQSENSRTWDVETESFYRLNKKTVFYGLVNYQNFTGKHMGGSVFINPREMPFNIVDRADSTRGNKNMESYRLTGAASIALNSRLHFGGKINYKAANYAKQKDLRHRNKFLDLSLSAGMSYSLKTVEFGFNYQYNRNIEDLYFDTFGNTDKQYMHLVDFGNFYGRLESYDDNNDGYISGSGSKPLFTVTHGGALQISLFLGSYWEWFNEFSFNQGEGYFGVDESSSVMYTKHNNTQWLYKTVLHRKRNKNLQKIQLISGNKKLTNFEKIFKYVSLPGEQGKVESLGEEEIFFRNYWHGNVRYDGYLGMKQLQPVWHISGEIEFFRREQETTLFPFSRTQEISFLQYNVFTERYFFIKNNQWSVKLGLGYGEGNGTRYKDKTYGTPSELNQEPLNDNLNLNRSFEYLTLPRMHLQAQIKYGIRMVKKNLVFLAVNYSFINGVNPHYLGEGRHYRVDIMLGTEF